MQQLKRRLIKVNVMFTAFCVYIFVLILLQMKKLNVASLLMIVCAVVVIVFQFYWINSLYKNEKNVIAKTTNALFKETVYEVQDMQTMNDTAFLTKAINDFEHLKTIGDGASKIAIDIWHQFKLGLKIVGKKNDIEKQKMIEGFAKTIKNNVTSKHNKTIENTDSVANLVDNKTTLPINDIKGLYKNKLSSSDNDINLPFEIFIEQPDAKNENIKSNSNFIYTNKVAIGQKQKTNYYAVFTSYQSHILNKILPQIITSICIVLFFIVSIVFAYKTLNKQKQLVAAKNDLISNITHEFKTPITTISVAIEAITKFGVIDDKELTKEYLQVSTDELNRLNLLVDKVLKLSLFENGKTELKTEKINIYTLIIEVINNMKPQFDKHNAIVHFNAVEKNIEIIADKSHIKSVVYNLLDNAIKYCEQQPQIVVDLQAIDKIIEITVTDNGIGIAANHQQKIFDKFYRVPQGNTHNAKGYGLGLSYISHIVNMHNGYINVSSVVGKGSKFTVGLINV